MMRLFWRFLLVQCVLLIASSAVGQGGAGGGAFGGGGFGGRGDFTGDSDEIRRQLFLTPGDRTEWTFDAKEHEGVVVKVTSNVFDPAVAVLDDKGKKLAENDDLAPGNQMAQLVFAAPKAGQYKVVVTNYKGTAGGQFEFNAQRFLYVDEKLGELTTILVGDKRARARATLVKPGDYVLTVRGASPRGYLNVMGPDGERVEYGSISAEFAVERYRISAKNPGDYYVDVPNVSGPSVRIAPVVVRQTEIGKETPADLPQDEVDDWIVTGKKGDLVEVSIPGVPDGISLDVTTVSDDEAGPLYALLNSQGILSTLAYTIIRDGQMRFTVIGTDAGPSSYRLRVARVGKPWPQNEQLDSSLDWFASEYWTFTAKPGDVIKLRGSAKNYEVSLLIVGPTGSGFRGRNMGHTAAVSSNFTVESSGQYVVSVSGGGIGSYHLEREVVGPKRLSLGVIEGDMKPGVPDVWRFEGKEGQDLALRISSKSLHWSVQATGPDGKSVGSLATRTGNDEDFLRLKLKATGTYTIVVKSSDDSAGKYTLKWIDLDK